MTCTIMAIDPGVKGAIAAVMYNQRKIERAEVYDMPIKAYSEPVHGTNRLKGIGLVDLGKPQKRVDVAQIRSWISSYRPDLVVLEMQLWMQKDGAKQTSLIWLNYGRLTAAIEGVGRVVEVLPQTWKPRIGVTSNKDTSLDLARATFPMCADQLKYKKHDGRAEALLLTQYGFWHELIPGQYEGSRHANATVAGQPA